MQVDGFEDELIGYSSTSVATTESRFQNMFLLPILVTWQRVRRSVSFHGFSDPREFLRLVGFVVLLQPGTPEN